MKFNLFDKNGMLIDGEDVIINELNSDSYITTDKVDCQDSEQDS